MTIGSISNKPLLESITRINFHSSSVIYLIYLCVFITLFPASSGSDINPQDPSKCYDDLHNCNRRLHVLYMLLIILLSLLILTYRIARTYKLSLIACEAKLQALLIIHHETSPRRFRKIGTSVGLKRQPQS
eukprot:320345_1